MENFRATTIVVVKKDGQVAMAGDGQVTLGHSVVKGSAKKIRKIGKSDVLAGFAGSAADAITLLEKFESKLERFSKNLERAAVELAKDWRTDKMLRKLEAMLVVADRERVFLISGQGDIIEPDDGVCSIGSGSTSALAAAKAFLKSSDLTAEEIARESIQIASEICIYTNNNISVESLGSNQS